MYSDLSINIVKSTGVRLTQKTKQTDRQTETQMVKGQMKLNLIGTIIIFIDLPSLVFSSSFLISSFLILSSRISLRISSLRVFLSIFIWIDTSVFTMSIKILISPSVPSPCPALRLTINKQIKQTLTNSMLFDDRQITQLFYSESV